MHYSADRAGKYETVKNDRLNTDSIYDTVIYLN